MKVRNLILRADTETLRLGRQWMVEMLAEHGGPTQARDLLDALRTVQDAGEMPGPLGPAALEAPQAAPEAQEKPKAPAKAS
jgi:hypothetical protein